MQVMIRRKLGWDDILPEDLMKIWKKWCTDLPKLSQYEIKRCIKPRNSRIISRELHHFTDASENGYGCVSYLRQEDESGKIHTSLMMGKSRVAPLKPVTIPRMELSAATLSVRNDMILRRELEIDIKPSYYWTDSMAVIKYLQNEDKRFKVFVANRIALIRSVSTPTQWNFIDGKSNVADCASRGQDVDTFSKNEEWKNGPEFLRRPKSEWPKQPGNDLLQLKNDDNLEVKQEKILVNSINEGNRNFLHDLFQMFSSWFKLKKTIAWLLRYKKKLMLAVSNRHKKEVKYDNLIEIRPITVDELRASERLILKVTQNVHFPEEYSTILGTKSLTSDRNQLKSIRRSVKKSSPIRKLDPIKVDGLLRIGGRLQSAPISESEKHPIILPTLCHVTELIIRHYHIGTAHEGRQYTLATIRKRFWVVKGDSTVRKIISGCVPCRKVKGKPVQQKMAPLPADRITPAPPFTNVGLDFFGPFEIKRGRAVVKRYGCIFTCLVVRAIHIEVCDNLSTDSFINALRRFMSRRGYPDKIRCDNGTNFIGGSKELKREFEAWNQKKIHETLLQKDVEWLFNPPSALHWGGVWERCIRTIRKSLSFVMKLQLVNEEEFRTLICEVESIVNGRPITPVTSDPDDLEPLTPNHLLLLRGGSKLPPREFASVDQYSRRRWRHVQYLADQFGWRWQREYIPLLQERQKNQDVVGNIKKGDIVLVADEKTHRSEWPLGRIVDVHTGRDDLVRSVRIKTARNVLVRPIVKCILLESTLN
ncbi:uncharacterized protein LOC141904302 [Tubulanus polymorphus]|uniref:uncharacterized protein LOC141904302 n=1 Tax=Tubulanus polymorphus TaxID=672921 RepID=UPI003DA3025B